MGITIRRILPENAREYALLADACWKSAYTGIMPEEFLRSREEEKFEQRVENYRQALGGSECDFYFAEYSERNVGLLGIRKSRDEDKPDAGEIMAIYLIEEFWGKGFGKELLKLALDALKSMGHSEIILWTLEENDRGRRFYERNGFVLDGAKKEMEFGKTLICLRYVLNLREEKL